MSVLTVEKKTLLTSGPMTNLVLLHELGGFSTFSLFIPDITCLFSVEIVWESYFLNLAGILSLVVEYNRKKVQYG